MPSKVTQYGYKIKIVIEGNGTFYIVGACCCSDTSRELSQISYYFLILELVVIKF